MMPGGHFAVAYLPFALYRLLKDRRLPDRKAFVVLLFATQLPDLIDKPLARTFGLIPSGRMLAHSPLLAPPFVLLVAVLAWHAGHDDLGAVFAFGFLTHPFADSYYLLWQGNEYAS